jgi:hypothetical protein
MTSFINNTFILNFISKLTSDTHAFILKQSLKIIKNEKSY